ncbi:acyltransferase [Granulicella sp. WH15]|uniref:acyltransferase family protein n=1 Tax=Granulicella sp. WH15 TaxID=2602070 RepID=UPI001366DD74|nr:acyltransferase [Granulicella sp. WH15]QHN04247.1 acyltransferase [Granulicella sp. WH15]
MRLQKQATQARPLTPAGSIALDVIRFGAAVAVVVGHLSNYPFSLHWPYLLKLALSAVAVFFVLSGFVIRLITKVRPIEARDYAIDRFSRLYSVTVPAVLFTLLAAFVLHLFPSTRLGSIVEFDLRKIAPQTLANLTFTAEIWGFDFPVSFNSVFWSLCYEFSYYCFYGLAFFGRGWVRWVSLVALALFVGPPILFLLPLWLFGCLIHDLYQKLRTQRNSLSYLTGIFATGLIAVVLLRPVLRSLGHRVAATMPHSSLTGLLHWSKDHGLHLLQRASFHAYVVGVPTGLLLLYLLLLLERSKLRKDHAVIPIIRRIADGTFSLYLFHLPLLMLFVAYIPYDRTSNIQKIALLLVTIALSVLIEIPLNHFKRFLRKKLSISSAASRSVVSTR